MVRDGLKVSLALQEPGEGRLPREEPIVGTGMGQVSWFIY